MTQEIQVRQQRKARYWRMLIALVASAAVFALYAWLVRLFVPDGYVVFLAYWIALYVIVLAVVLYIDQPRDWKILTYVLWVTFIFGYLFVIGLPPRGPSDKPKEAEVKQNLMAIQLCIERYAENHGGAYPPDPVIVSESVGVDYSSLRNPFAGENRAMRPIPLGATEPYGDYTYVPVIEDEKAIGYYLFAYGSERTRGFDVDGDGEGDHVIMVLSSEDRNYDPLPREGEYQGTLPPLSSLVSAPDN